MTDNKHKLGDLIMTQGTSDYFQSDSNFEKRLSLLKDKIREFFNLKNIYFRRLQYVRPLHPTLPRYNRRTIMMVQQCHGSAQTATVFALCGYIRSLQLSHDDESPLQN